jgi:hypothetical protein
MHDIDHELAELNARCILDMEDDAKKIKAIARLQIEIESLNEQFKIPLFLFMKHHERLIDFHLAKSAHYKKTESYHAQPEYVVKDLLNFIYCLAGYGAFYSCPTDSWYDPDDV